MKTETLDWVHSFWLFYVRTATSRLQIALKFGMHDIYSISKSFGVNLELRRIECPRNRQNLFCRQRGGVGGGGVVAYLCDVLSTSLQTESFPGPKGTVATISEDTSVSCRDLLVFLPFTMQTARRRSTLVAVADENGNAMEKLLFLKKKLNR